MPAAYVTLGWVHDATGKHDLALQEFQQALPLDGNATAMRGLARAYEKIWPIPDAEATFRERLRCDQRLGHLSSYGGFCRRRGSIRRLSLNINRRCNSPRTTHRCSPTLVAPTSTPEIRSCIPWPSSHSRGRLQLPRATGLRQLRFSLSPGGSLSGVRCCERKGTLNQRQELRRLE